MSIRKITLACKSDPALLARILLMISAPKGDPVTSPDTATPYLLPLLAGYDRERFAVLALDRARRVIASEVLFVGAPAFTVVCPRTVVRWALKHGADGILVAHNHPSGSLHPSEQDHAITRSLGAACRTVGVALVDHMIEGRGSFFSFAANREPSLG